MREKKKKMSNTKDFSCVGGLEKQIRIVKEMVLFPLMYGEVYAKFNLRPPRGLLFYGPPGKVKVFIDNKTLPKRVSAFHQEPGKPS